MKKRFLLVGLAAGLVLGAVGTASAVTLASSPTYSACSTTGHVLLVQVKGKCPSGSHKVTISARGPQGKTGPAGKAAPVVTFSYRYGAWTDWDVDTGSITAFAYCPKGSAAVGGGGIPSPGPLTIAQSSGFPADPATNEDPIPRNSGWVVVYQVSDVTTGNWFAQAFVVCAS
jgi:hypothetical protein